MSYDTRGYLVKFAGRQLQLQTSRISSRIATLQHVPDRRTSSTEHKLPCCWQREVPAPKAKKSVLTVIPRGGREWLGLDLALSICRCTLRVDMLRQSQQCLLFAFSACFHQRGPWTWTEKCGAGRAILARRSYCQCNCQVLIVAVSGGNKQTPLHHSRLQNSNSLARLLYVLRNCLPASRVRAAPAAGTSFPH